MSAIIKKPKQETMTRFISYFALFWISIGLVHGELVEQGVQRICLVYSTLRQGETNKTVSKPINVYIRQEYLKIIDNDTSRVRLVFTGVRSVEEYLMGVAKDEEWCLPGPGISQETKESWPDSDEDPVVFGTIPRVIKDLKKTLWNRLGGRGLLIITSFLSNRDIAFLNWIGLPCCVIPMYESPAKASVLLGLSGLSFGIIVLENLSGRESLEDLGSRAQTLQSAELHIITPIRFQREVAYFVALVLVLGFLGIMLICIYYHYARALAPAKRTPSIDLEALNALPLHFYRAPADGEALICMICMETFEKDNLCRTLPCQHQFHPYCIDPWLINQYARCPYCQKSVVS
ncbi:hypothetical protein NEHOM01_1710 [Nematocida homosporus]|uniref:uncharacterized protein n=1 Tax=Nematocida homosporus TaxID=1912981 RepID=UPI00221F00B7|nr:uncharacterized protein NEHOM01_1710 [Nematocida homosporus]KAI5186790.1 hypothetical protein NEHOM01_1710 [Nematocida homosporus]